MLHQADRKRRKVLGGLIGSVFGIPVYFFSGTFVGFLAWSCAQAILTAYITEILYGKVYSDIENLEVGRKFTAFVYGVSLMIVIGSTFFIWTNIYRAPLVLIGHASFSDGPKVVENGFNKQCTKIDGDVVTPWFYEEGCSNENPPQIAPSRNCIEAISAVCAATSEETMPIPRNCQVNLTNSTPEFGDKFDISPKTSDANKSVICPN